MKIIKRSSCFLSDKNDIEHLYTFKDFPVYMGCSDNRYPDADEFADMKWGYSNSSGGVQLMELLDPAELYNLHHNSGTVGLTWKRHHHIFYEFISRQPCTNILEIGGASGELAKVFLENSNSKYTIIEPSAQSISDNPRFNFIQGLFEIHPFEDKFDTVIHSHVFEHVYNPSVFLQKVADLLEYGDNHYIAMPNMRYWLENGYTSTLTFEHTCFIDEQILEHLLSKNGFEVIDKIIEPHSIFIRCVKSRDVKTTEMDFSYSKDLFKKYINDLETDVKNINKMLAGQKFYLFGAHIFAQTLINLGLNERQIINILDNDPKKQGQRLYGTNLIVNPPTCLIDAINPIVVLRAGPYNDEIKTSILKINPSTTFI